MPALTWEMIKKQPVSIGTAIMAVLAVLWLYNWLGATFVTKAEAAEYNTQISAQVAGNTQIMTDLTKEFRVSAALARVESLDAKAYRMESAGVDAQTLRDVKKELRNAELYRDCLLNNRPNCALLKR